MSTENREMSSFYEAKNWKLHEIIITIYDTLSRQIIKPHDRFSMVPYIGCLRNWQVDF